MQENKNWYVVYTRPRWEKKVALLMQEKGMEHYCPLNRVQKQWSDRKKIVLEPLFKGYVFVAIDKFGKNEVLQVEGVLNFVHWLGKPAIVKESEIQTIKKFLHEFTDVEVTSNTVSEKDHVMIRNGVLMNYKGIVIEVKGRKARVRIESMGLQLSAVFDKKNLKVL
jgi:transcription antitermination factor NusG